ncbi:TlpA family protein disulfide reductase [Hanstruepera marina]|uniref:TlpA family protein disulfide reductase n=1 Tax=Hanstruepera marina TaxID=2873265 RepID=UPI001CA6D8EA|nr:TlpA disulfide reductase family protein [Hanstruepera marina]
MNLGLKIKILYCILFIGFQAFSQISFDDPLTVIKAPDGKVLKKADMQKIMKSGKQFSMYSVKKGDTTVYYLEYKTKDEIGKKKLIRSNLKSTLLNKPLSSFSLSNMDGKTINKTKLLGKVTVFNFWFTGCVPCIREMPELNELVNEYEDKVNFIAPTFNTKEEVQKFLTKKQFKYDILYDSKQLNELLNIESYPTHIIIDEKGVVREVIFGANLGIKKQLQTGIKKLLE